VTNKTDHDLLIGLAQSVSNFHAQYAADEVRKDAMRSEAKLAQKEICDAQNKWIRNIQRDLEILKTWRTLIIGGATVVLGYFKVKGKI
jgi:hypothetical protein